MKALSILSAVIFFLWAGVASADRPASYQYLAGGGILCSLPVPNLCPDVSTADNGDRLELGGTGTFSTEPGSAVTGGGTFTHRRGDGSLVATGVWTAEKYLSFHSYGVANPSLGLPAGASGGLLTLRVHLAPDAGGPGLDATLQIECALGPQQPAKAFDGVRLVVQNAINFNKKVSGGTLFILSD